MLIGQIEVLVEKNDPRVWNDLRLSAFALPGCVSETPSMAVCRKALPIEQLIEPGKVVITEPVNPFCSRSVACISSQRKLRAKARARIVSSQLL
jgi:hypothetical protein